MKKSIIYIIFIISLFLIGITSVEAAEHCVNKLGTSKCPCTDTQYSGNDAYDPAFLYAYVEYTDKDTGNKAQLTMGEWLEVAKKGDRATGIFHYGADSKFAEIPGRTRTEAVAIKKVDNSSWKRASIKERGYTCVDDIYRTADPIQEIPPEEKQDSDEPKIYTCDMFLTSKLYTEILQPAYVAIKIAAPCLVIALGTIDIVSAVIAEDADKMKKAQAKLAKRIIIGIAVFFLPTILNSLFKLANVATSTCHIK